VAKGTKTMLRPKRRSRLQAASLARPSPVERKPSKVAVPSEEAEQLELVWWLEWADITYCHVPNGEWRHPRTAVRLKALGVKMGVPDILIFTPPPKFKNARGVAIELKRVNVRRATPAQQAWLVELGAAGWCVQICSGAQMAIGWLQSLGYGHNKA
jgi:hypothetical protein